MQRLLALGIRKYLRKEERETIIDICSFFQLICARRLRVDDLKAAHEHIISILCKMELIFPPVFFDIIVHLVLHLSEEAINGGPIQNRLMYLIERYIGTLKKYVRNCARQEGSIAEGYVVSEDLTFCSM